MKEHLSNQETRDTGISTAALAHANETPDRTASATRNPDQPAAEEGAHATLVAANQPDSGVPNRKQDGPGPEAVRGRDSRSVSTTSADEEVTPLMATGESKQLYDRWEALQVGFIDEPRQAVEQADHLVAGTMKRLAEVFADERARLEAQWDRGGNVSTEDLRVTMRRYRSFFRRLLSV